MKNKLVLFLFALIFTLPAYAEASNYTTKNQTESISKSEALGGGKRNKNGRYRKKKGFMWGLFKGKNQCDCPKH
jgi:DNA modification methylase